MSGVVASAAPVVAEDPQPTSPGQAVRTSQAVQTSPYVALVRYVTSIEKALDDAVEKAAATTGRQYIDVWSSSASHDACRSIGLQTDGPVLTSVVGQLSARRAALATGS